MTWEEIVDNIGRPSQVSRSAMLGAASKAAWNGKEQRAYSEHARELARAWMLIGAAYADQRPWTHGERQALKATLRFLGISQRSFERDIQKAYPGIKHRRAE